MRHVPLRLLVWAAVLSCAGWWVGAPGAAEATFPGRNGNFAGIGETIAGWPALYSVGSNGDMARRLDRWYWPPEGLSYSPDGRRLTFMASKRSSPGHISIWTIRADGTHLRRRVLNAIVPRTWTADGRHFIYADQADPNDDTDWQIFRSRIDGSHVRQLTHFPAGEPSVVGYVPPVMSPDGERIAFLGVTPGDNPDVFVSRSDGSDLRRVTTTPRTHDYSLYKYSLGWSPDSAHIIFSAQFLTTYPNSTSWIESAAADGSQLQRIVKGVYPIYSPDGRYLVYWPLQRSGWIERNLKTGTETPLTLTDSYRAGIDTWQPWTGHQRLTLRLSIVATHHPFDGYAYAQTDPARAGDQVIFHSYHRVDGEWKLIETFDAGTNRTGRAEDLAIESRLRGMCKVTARFIGDRTYLPARAARVFRCTTP